MGEGLHRRPSGLHGEGFPACHLPVLPFLPARLRLKIVVPGICYDSTLPLRHDRKMDRDRTRLLSFDDALRPDAKRMLRAITGFAELPLQEKRTSETLAAFLTGRGFRVERGIAGMDTAFRAEVSFGRGKTAVGFLCEGDGLPGLGHDC